MTATKVYVSAPIDGYDIKERKRYFRYVCMKLAEMGYLPVNPMENGLSADEPKKKHLKIDFHLLTDCDMILLCDGWDTSEGCQKEATVALWSGIEILPSRIVGIK